ncbi:unnamed protein product, partial [Amoebophrya sp. A120]
AGGRERRRPPLRRRARRKPRRGTAARDPVAPRVGFGRSATGEVFAPGGARAPNEFDQGGEVPAGLPVLLLLSSRPPLEAAPNSAAPPRRARHGASGPGPRGRANNDRRTAWRRGVPA